MGNRQHTTSWRPAPMHSVELQEELRQAIAGPAPDHSKRWSARTVAAWIFAKLGRPVRVQLGWDYVQRLKHSQQLPRPQHALADPEEQTAFKKTPSLAKAGGHSLSAGQGRGLGHGRASHWLETAAASGLGTDWSAPAGDGAPPLCVALSGGLCPSRLGSDRLASGYQRFDSAF